MSFWHLSLRASPAGARCEGAPAAPDLGGPSAHTPKVNTISIPTPSQRRFPRSQLPPIENVFAFGAMRGGARAVGAACADAVAGHERRSWLLAAAASAPRKHIAIARVF